MTVTSTSLALLILCLMTFRDILRRHWLFARTPNYGRLIMLLGMTLFLMIAFNSEFWQPPSRLLSGF